MGACCYFDGTCEILTPDECFGGPGMWGGIWLGPDTACDECGIPPMDEGACCFNDDTCEILTEFACWDAWGRWLGPDSTCDMCDMPEETGACCFDDGTCEITAPEACSGEPGSGGGEWSGRGTPCH